MDHICARSLFVVGSRVSSAAAAAAVPSRPDDWLNGRHRTCPKIAMSNYRLLLILRVQQGMMLMTMSVTISAATSLGV